MQTIALIAGVAVVLLAFALVYAIAKALRANPSQLDCKEPEIDPTPEQHLSSPAMPATARGRSQSSSPTRAGVHPDTRPASQRRTDARQAASSRELLEAGEQEHAVQESDSATDINSKDADEHYNRGVAYVGQFEAVQDERAWQAALDRASGKRTDAAVLDNLGLTDAERDLLDKAIQEFEAALRINPDHAEGHAYLGAAYAQQKRWDKAAPELEAALSINPDLVETHYHLGVAYYNQGRRSLAVSHLITAADLGSTTAQWTLGQMFHS